MNLSRHCYIIKDILESNTEDMKELNMFYAGRWCIGNTIKLKQLLEKRMTKKK